MITIILQLGLVMVNLWLSKLMYYEKNYKTAMFNTFAAGVCFCGFIYGIYKYIKV